MFTITQGTPTDQQVMVIWGIVIYLIVGPLLLLAAALCGTIIRAKRNAAQTASAPPAAFPPAEPRSGRLVAAPSTAPDISAAI
jgi:hypothetical protein